MSTATKPAHTPTPFSDFSHEISETEVRGDGYLCAALYAKHPFLGVQHLGALSLSLHPCASPEEIVSHRELVDALGSQFVRAVNSHAELVRVMKLLVTDAKAKGVEPVLIGMAEDAIFKAQS